MENINVVSDITITPPIEYPNTILSKAAYHGIADFYSEYHTGTYDMEFYGSHFTYDPRITVVKHSEQLAGISLGITVISVGY